ncbi:MAG TPA: DciA family protein [Gallionella sp.]
MSKPLTTIFSSCDELLALQAKVRILSSLQSHFASVAPGYLARSAQVIGLQHGQLSIAATNATVAAKLRQLAPELAILLQNRGCEVSGIRIKVQVSFDLPQPKRTPRKLSPAAQRALQAFSMELDDSALKRTLQRLSHKS